MTGESFCTRQAATSGKLERIKDAPEPRGIQPPEKGAVVAVSQAGGLHHRYERRAS